MTLFLITQYSKRLETSKKKILIIRLLKYLAGLLLLAILSVVLLFSLVYFDFFGRLPDKQQLSSIINEEASLIYSEDGVMMGKIFAENRTSITFDQIPDHLKKALIATEDKRYYTHNGYDGKSYMRVLFKSILGGDKSGGGGSTITQQLIKNLYGRQYEGFLSMPINKIKELITAQRIEEIYTKEEILLLYFNSVPFGEDLYGIETAAQRFFNKSVSELKVEEAAVLVGMLKANTYYNPRLHPKNALERRNTILQLMNNEYYLTDKTTDSLQKLPLTLNYQNQNLKNTAGYFVYQVKKKATQVIDEINKSKDKKYNLKTDGLRIHTTLNYSIQEIAERAAQEQLLIKQKELDRELRSNSLKRNWLKTQKGAKLDSLWKVAKRLNASVLLTNPKNGAVISWVGGNDFQKHPFDMVLSHRQIASAFKPVLYATAFDNGFSACDYLENEVKSYPEFENWTPRNANHNETPDSKVALWYALINSMNLPTVDLYFKNNRAHLLHSCKKLDFPKIKNDAPSIALGTLDLSLSEIVKAYGTFANEGEMNDLYMITKITDKKGKIIYQSKPEIAQRVFKKESTQTLTAILQQAVEQGTSSKIRNTYGIKSPLASKTGTAQNYSDAWFVAYTPNLVLGTWVGTSTNAVHFSSGKGSGSSLALPIIAKILQELEKKPQLRQQYLTSFDIPEEVYAFLQCEAFKEKGVKGFINRLFEKRKERREERREKRRQRKEERKSKKKWWQLNR